MKNIILLIASCFISFHTFSQHLEQEMNERTDSLRRAANRETLSSFLLNQDSDGLIYGGITGSYEVSSYFLGGEFKLYDSHYIPMFSGSIYTNYKHSINRSGKEALNAISLGGHFTIIGLEGTVYFNKGNSYFYLTPKVGFDYGSWSIFYGYGLPISRPRMDEAKGHNISLKYLLYFSEFKYHRMRRKAHGY